MQPLHHFYHVFADGAYEVPVREHALALQRDGLLETLETLQVGLVGTPASCADALQLLDEVGLGRATVVATADEGWEQVTLHPLHAFAQDHDGYVAYAHTKGSANFAEINDAWRRSMEFYNYVQWRQPVALLDRGAKAVGCHWYTAAPAAQPGFGVSGMFGGNYWWADMRFLRLAPPCELDSRHAAEHWVGRMSEVTPLVHYEHIVDLHPGPIVAENLKSDWLPQR